MQKAYAEGLRAIYLYTAAHQDPVVAEAVSGADADMAIRVNDLLLPIIKGVGSERAYQYLTESLQTLGGSGFLQDYPIEQYIRDAKIDSLYEGTTAIQAQDFFFRKIARDKGVALAHVAGQIQSFIDSDVADQRLKVERDYLRTALEDVQAITATLTGYLMGSAETPTELYKIGLGSVRYLLAVGDLLIGWQLLFARRNRPAGTGFRHDRQGAGLLRGQDRRGAVLCRQRAARDIRDARHLGPHVDRIDGSRRRRILTPTRRYRHRSLCAITTWPGSRVTLHGFPSTIQYLETTSCSCSWMKVASRRPVARKHRGARESPYASPATPVSI